MIAHAFIPVVVAALVLAAPVAAQQRRIELGASGLSVGALFVDMGPFNRATSSLGFPGLEDHFGTVGAGGQARFGRWTIGGVTENLLPQSRMSGSQSVSAHGTIGTLEAGWAVVAKRAVRITPSIGIGFNSLEVRLSNQTASSFDAEVADPQSSNLAARGFLGIAGVQVERPIFRVGGTELTTGARGGYMFRLNDIRWRSGEDTLADGPVMSLAGPYVRVGFWFSRPRDNS